MLAFTCALAGASSWVMWCTRHSAHVSSSYSLISAVAGVGVATAGASNVNWGWNEGKGMGAIFSGLVLAPLISGGFASTIFMLIKVTVHMRSNPVPWAIYTSPFFFLIAGTVCALSIVYKGSPNLGLADKPAWYIASVSLGVGGGLMVLAALFFVPFLYMRVIHRDATIQTWEIIKGPLLWKRTPPETSDQARVPNYAVVQHDEEDSTPVSKGTDRKSITDVDVKTDGSSDEEISPAHKDEKIVDGETQQKTYKELMAEGQERFHARLRKKKGPLGWAMRTLHENPLAEGEIYEFRNLRIFFFKRLPAMIVAALLYGVNYDIHAAQTGVQGTPEAKRMTRTYAHAKKYPNEVEHTYSYVQVITACTASFAHGANDIGNAAGPWAVIYGAWWTGNAAESEAAVPVWQLAVLAVTLSVGLMTYGFNIMKVMGNKITYHSPSRGESFLQCLSHDLQLTKS
jgi:solute carrier family 20 (sodium-dependent phosphate transporter)